MTQPFEIGIEAYGEVPTDPFTGVMASPRQRMADALELARVADEVGLDIFATGEHHRGDYYISTPHTVLAAAAMVTKHVRLTSGVTVLSSDDPVRVFENFATLDLISNGRAEIIAGRGSYIESFPLFGYNIDDYAELFREKLDLLLTIRDTHPVNWRGRFRAPLVNADIAPRPVGDLPIWVGVGGTPASAIRTGMLGLPMVLGVLLGPITAFQRVVELYRQAGAESGHDSSGLRIGFSAHGLVARTSQAARETSYPYFRGGARENNHQRGVGFDIPRAAFDAQTTPGGSLLVGSPQEVIDKLMTFHELYGADRAILTLGFGGVPQKQMLESVELLGTEVAPVIRREVASRRRSAA